MMKFLRLLIHFRQQIMRRKAILLVFIIMPALCFPAAFLLFGKKAEAPPGIAYYSESRDSALEFFIRALSAGNKYRIEQLNYAEGKTAASKKELKAFLVFPDKFNQHIQSHAKQIITVLSAYPEASLLTLENDLDRLLENYLELTAYSRQSREDLESLVEKYFMSYSDISRVTVPDFPGNNRAAARGAGLLVFVIMLQIFYTTGLLIKSRNETLTARLASSGITFPAFILSNITASMLFSYIQITAALIPALLIFNQGPGFPVYSLYLFFTPFCLMTAAAGIIISSASRREKSASDLALVLTVPSCMLSGSFWSLDGAPAVFERIAGFFPQYWLIDALKKLQYFGEFKNTIINLLVLSCFLLLTVLIFLYVYRNLPRDKKRIYNSRKIQ